MNLILSILRHFDKAISQLKKAILYVSLITMLLLSSFLVLLRNFVWLKSAVLKLSTLTGIPLDPSSWGDLLVRHLVLFLLFFGASLATRGKQHLQMDLSHKIIPEKWRPLTGLIINAFCIYITYFLMIAAYIFMKNERLDATILFNNVPTWYFIALMPIGFGLIGLRFCINLIENIFTLTGQPANSITKGNK